MPEEDNSLDASGGSKLYDTVNSSLETTAPVVQAIPARRRPSLFKFNRLAFTVTGGTLAAIAIIVGLAFLFNQVQNSKANEIAGKKGSYDVSTISTNGIQQNDSLKVGTADSLDVNGQLQVSNTVVLTPTSVPTAPEAGQIYYDKTLNSLFYYNGSVFVPVANQNSVVSSLGGLTGAINPGAGLSAVGGSLQNTGVLSVQGQTGNVTFTAGGGVEISGTTISTVALPAGQLVLGTGASGFTTVAQASGAGQCLISTLGAPVFGSCTGSTQVTSLNGLINGLNLVAGTGINITDNGTNTITIAAPASAAISAINGQTGPTLTVANATAASNIITINNAAADGSTKGIAAFNATNFSASSGVINTIQGISSSASPTFANLTSSGYLKGTELRNGTDVVFTLPVTGSGASRELCYVDNTNSSNCPTGGNVSFGTTHTSNKIAALDGSGNLVDSELSTLTGGLQYAGSGYLLDLVSGSTSTLTVDNSGAGVANLSVSGKVSALQGFLNGIDTYTLPTNGGNGGVLCYVYSGASNCPTGGNISQGTAQTSGRLAKYDSVSNTITNSLFGDDGTTLTAYGNLNLQNFVLNANSITSNSGGIELDAGTGGSDTITFYTANGANSFILPTTGGLGQTICTTAITCASGGGQAVILEPGASPQSSAASTAAIFINKTLAGTGNLIQLQANGADKFVINNKGELSSLLFNGGTAGTDYVSLSGGTQTGAGTITIPNLTGGSYDLCLSSGNCAGSGGGITGSGSANTIAMFTGSGTIGNSVLSQSGGNLTSSGDVIVQGGDVTLGVASSQTGSLSFKHSGSAFTGTVIQGSLSGDQTYTLPDSTGDFCLSSGNCIGGGGGGAPNGATYLTTSLDGTLTAERVLTAGTNISVSDGGANSTFTVSVSSTPTFSGLVTANGGLTVEAGDTFTFNGDAFTDLTGTGLQISTGSLQTTLGTSVDLTSEVTGTLAVSNGGTGATTLALNGILYGNGTSAVQATLAASNSVLVTDGSNVPSLSQTLPTAVQGNITSTGALASGSIASGFGTISTGNNISTTANVQGANVNATTALQVGGVDINTAGTLTNVAYLNAATNNFTGSASIQGASGLTLGGGFGGSQGKLGLYRTSGGYVTLQALDAAGSYTLDIPAIVANDTLCLQTAANCSGGVGAIGALDGQTKSANGAVIDTATLYLQSADASFPGLVTTGTQTLAGAKTFSGAAVFSAAGTGLTVNNNASVLGSGGITVGVAGSTQGRLVLATSGAGSITLQAPSIGSNYSVSIPGTIATNDTFCLLTTGNCVGAGGGVTSSGGATNYVPRYTGATTLTAGTIFDDGTNVSVGGSSPAGKFNVGSSNQFQVSSAGAVTAVGVNAGAGLLQGSLGLTVSGAAANINATGSGAVTIGNNTGNTALTLDSGTGAINIGTGAQARTVNIATGAAAQTVTLGSTTGASALTLQGGSSGITATSTATTGTSMAIQGNSVTTGTGLSVAANGLTTGNALSVTSSSANNLTGNLASLAQTGSFSGSPSVQGNVLNVSRVLSGTFSGPTTVTLDATYPVGGYQLGTATEPSVATWNHTVGNYSNRALVVTVAGFSNPQACTVTYGGVNVPLATSRAAAYVAAIYVLTSPAVGTASVVVSCANGLGTFNYVTHASSTSWYNVSQSTPYVAATPLTGSKTINVTTVANDMAIVVYNGNGAVPSTGAGQTNISPCVTFYTVGNQPACSSYELATGVTTVMDYTGGGTANEIAAIALKQASSTSLDVGGSVASLSSNCTASSCTDSSNILNLNQQFATATGAVLKIQNSGTGADIQLGRGTIQTVDGTSTNGVSIKSGAASAGASGALTLQSGTGTTGTGAISLQSGAASAGASGALALQSGTGTTGTGAISLQSGAASAGSTGALTIQSGNATGGNSGGITIDSGSATGTAGNISIGTGAYAHNTTIGNATGSSTLTLQSGTGGIALSSTATTNNAASLTANSVTTGTALAITANALSTGTGLSVASSGANYTGTLAAINQNGTYNLPSIVSGNTFSVARSNTVNASSAVVTLDATYPVGGYQLGTQADPSVATWNHTVGNYSNRALVVTVAGFSNPHACTVTYGGINVPLATSRAAAFVADIYVLTAPAVGTAAVVVSCTGSLGGFGYTAHASSTSWYNVNQSTSYVAATPLANVKTINVTTVANDMAIVVYSGNSPASSAGAGQTNISPCVAWYTGLTNYACSSYELATGVTTVMDYTGGGTGVEIAAIALKQASTVTTSITGAAASFSSNCSASGIGVCTDTSNILRLNQQYASASGAVLNIQNAGTGADIQLGSGIIRPGTDSTTAVRLQNSAGTSTLLNADTTNMTLTVGPTTPAPVYAAKVDYTTGTNPSGVALGDVNGDGKSDLVAANAGAGFGTTVSVLLNNGSGTFAAKVDYTTGGGPNSVALGDVNGDGYLDIVTTNGGASGAGTTISVLINNGNGTFATKVDYTVGSGPTGVALGDINGDSKLDIAVANQTTSTVSTLTNKGNGTFNTKVDYATAADPWDVALADVNADGKTDMVVSNTTPNSVSVYINSAVIGTFAAKVDYSTGASTAPRGIELADLNADGKPDVVTGNYGNNTASVLLNSGTGTFPSNTTYATASGTFDVALADLNGDGRRDIATANTTGATVSVLMNTGSGAFGSKTDYAAGTNSNKIALGDVNSDGRPDIATSNNTATSASIFINGSVSLAVSGHSSFGRISLQGGLTVAGLSLFQDSILSRNSVNSNSAFAIQNSAGVNLLNADTVNMRVSVGSRGTATGQLFIAGDMPAAALSSTGGANNTWGVDVEGRYAYIATAATTNGLQVFDVSNPASPLQFGSANASSSAKKRIKVQGKYAYTASAGVSGTGTFEIFDISNPKTPVSVGSQTYTTTGSGNQPALYVQGRYAYVGDGSTRTLWVFDVANPASMPTAIQLTTGASGSGIADIYAQGRYVYLAESGATATAQFQIIDMNNPLVPTIVGTVSNTYISGAVTSLAVQGRVAYVGNSTGTIYAVDIKDPTQASPSVTSVAMGGAAAGLYAQGRTLYVADSTSNLIRSVDISTPGTPLGITGTSPMTGGASAQSLLVAGRYLYAVTSSSPTNTLQIFDLGGTYSQQLEAGGVETDTLTVRANSNIAGDQTIQGGLTVGGSTNLQGDMAVVGTSKFSGNLTGTSYATATATYSTTVGASVNTTSVTVNSATGFAAGDVIFINNAGQDYYTRITNIASNTFTVTPAVDVDANSGATPAVTKYVTQNIGAVSTGAATPSLSDRFFQGYFLGGVVTGAGSTTLSDGNLQSTGKMNYTATGHLFTSTATTTSGLSVTANSLTTGSAINLTVSPTYTTVSTNSPGALNITRSVTANPTIPAVTVDQTFAVATSNTSGQNSRTATTNAATLANQTNMFIVAHVAATGGFTNYSCSMTYNGNSMTDVSTGGLFGSGTNSYTFIYATPTPNASGTIVASCSDPSYGNQLYNVIVAGNSFYNVSTYAGYAAGSGSSTPTFSLNSGDLAVDGAYNSSGVPTNGWTQRAAASSAYTAAMRSVTSSTGASGVWPGSPWANRGIILRAPVSPVTINGNLANISSTCTVVTGSCVDSSVLLNLNQQYASATGNVLNISNSGSGNAIDVTNSAGKGLNITSSGTATGINITNSGTGTSIFANNTSSGKSVDIQSAGTSVFTISNTASSEGAVLFKNRTNNSAAFTIQNAAGSSLLNISTTPVANPGSLITNGSFETDTSGWTTLSRVGSNASDGSYSGYMSTASTATATATLSSSLLPSTTYTLTYHMSGMAAYIGTLTPSFAGQNCTAKNWYDSGVFTCTLTTPASPSYNTVAFALTVGFGTGTVNIDAVRIEQGSTSSGYGTVGSTTLAGNLSLSGYSATINSATTINNTALVKTNSATAFQVQDASGNAMLTLSTNNYLAGSGNYLSQNAVLKVAADSGTGRSINAVGSINNSNADFAEWIPWFTAKPTPGSVIEYQGNWMVVSSTHTAAFIGNDGIYDAENAILVTLTGQVPVKISSPVSAGDYLVPNGDGTARGVAPANATLTDYFQKVGVAIEASSGVTVKALVNAPGASAAFNPQANTSFTDINISGTLTVNNLEVSGTATFNGNIIVGGHVITAGNTPDTQVLSAAGAGATITIDGNDTAGTITITTGGGATAGDLGKLIFSNAFGKAPKTILSAQDEASQDAKIFPSGKSASQFILRTSQALPASTYTFDYFIVQ